MDVLKIKKLEQRIQQLLNWGCISCCNSWRL